MGSSLMAPAGVHPHGQQPPWESTANAQLSSALLATTNLACYWFVQLVWNLTTGCFEDRDVYPESPREKSTERGGQGRIEDMSRNISSSLGFPNG